VEAPDPLPFLIELLNTGGALLKIVDSLADGLAANLAELRLAEELARRRENGICR
jgi:hypothetical protein